MFDHSGHILKNQVYSIRRISFNDLISSRILRKHVLVIFGIYIWLFPSPRVCLTKASAILFCLAVFYLKIVSVGELAKASYFKHNLSCFINSLYFVYDAYYYSIIIISLYNYVMWIFQYHWFINNSFIH